MQKKIREDEILVCFFPPIASSLSRMVAEDLWSRNQVLYIKWNLLIFLIIPGLWALCRMILDSSGFWILVHFPSTILWAFEANFCCLTCAFPDPWQELFSISFFPLFPASRAHCREVRWGMPAYSEMEVRVLLPANQGLSGLFSDVI